MLPHKHGLISAGVGAVGWWYTKEPGAFLAALATGVLPDVDHVVDYAYYYLYRTHRLILPCHGYEYAVIGIGLSLTLQNAILGVATLSYLVHLLADQAENSTKPLGYALFFRLWHRFRLEAISTMPEAAARGRLEDLHAINRILSRWLKR